MISPVIKYESVSYGMLYWWLQCQKEWWPFNQLGLGVSLSDGDPELVSQVGDFFEEEDSSSLTI